MTGASSRRYRGRSADERRADRRERLLQAGLELYGTAGYQAASVERLCEVAGLSTRQFYEEFPNRNELLLELFDRVQTQASAAVEAAWWQAHEDGADLRELLRRCTEAYVAAIGTDPRWARVAYVTVVGVTPDIEEHRQARRTAWARLLRQLAEDEAQRGRIPRRDFRLIMRGHVGSFNELVHVWCTQETERPITEIVDTLVHLLHSSLTAPVEG